MEASSSFYLGFWRSIALSVQLVLFRTSTHCLFMLLSYLQSNAVSFLPRPRVNGKLSLQPMLRRRQLQLKILSPLSIQVESKRLVLIRRITWLGSRKSGHLVQLANSDEVEPVESV